MACFLIPAAEAAVAAVAEKAVEKNEPAEAVEGGEVQRKLTLSRKLHWLTYMLVGGAILLMFEHIWHGEVTPFFPFLTAMNDPADTFDMLREMATTGVGMALLVTGVWAVMCAAADSIMKRSDSDETVEEEA